MCCFSGRVDKVADTNIFARAAKAGRQYLVYSMRFQAAADVAMILPIPTPKASAEDAVKFLNLEKYPEFFTDMASGFPAPRAKGRGPALAGGVGAPKLAVVEVGRFVASFVPMVKDFARLDERFRLPTATWDALPRYKDWGFAVFQLRKGEGEQKVHPMAFEFPSTDPKRLFFPTVHIHDGKVHEKARFDHWLYCQANGLFVRWEESPQPAGMFVRKHKEANGIVDPEAHVYRRRLAGVLANEDWVV